MEVTKNTTSSIYGTIVNQVPNWGNGFNGVWILFRFKPTQQVNKDPDTQQQDNSPKPKDVLLCSQCDNPTSVIHSCPVCLKKNTTLFVFSRLTNPWTKCVWTVTSMEWTYSKPVGGSPITHDHDPFGDGFISYKT